MRGVKILIGPNGIIGGKKNQGTTVFGQSDDVECVNRAL